MYKILSFLLMISMAQLSVGQKISNTDILDDMVITNQRVSLFSLSKKSVTSYTDKVSSNDVYILDMNVRDAIVSDAPET